MRMARCVASSRDGRCDQVAAGVIDTCDNVIEKLLELYPGAAAP